MSDRYWNKRYGEGGTSGKGSIGKERKWKWGIIKRYCKPKESSFLDLGCGDLSFWEKKPRTKYTGLDYSRFAIDRNRKAWPDHSFINGPISSEVVSKIEHHNVALCFDVMFHQPDPKDYWRLLGGLDSANADLLFVTNYDIDIFHTPSDYMSYRDLSVDLSFLESWYLISKHTWNADSKVLYVLKKR